MAGVIEGPKRKGRIAMARAGNHNQLPGFVAKCGQ